MAEFNCNTCKDTGEVTVANGPEDFDVVPCPDCDLGLSKIDNEDTYDPDAER